MDFSILSIISQRLKLFSNTFGDNTGNKVIGRKLLGSVAGPFLWIRMVVAFFQESGNTQKVLNVLLSFTYYKYKKCKSIF